MSDSDPQQAVPGVPTLSGAAIEMLNQQAEEHQRQQAEAASARERQSRQARAIADSPIRPLERALGEANAARDKALSAVHASMDWQAAQAAVNQAHAALVLAHHQARARGLMVEEPPPDAALVGAYTAAMSARDALAAHVHDRHAQIARPIEAEIARLSQE